MKNVFCPQPKYIQLTVTEETNQKIFTLNNLTENLIIVLKKCSNDQNSWFLIELLTTN